MQFDNLSVTLSDVMKVTTFRKTVHQFPIRKAFRHFRNFTVWSPFRSDSEYITALTLAQVVVAEFSSRHMISENDIWNSDPTQVTKWHANIIFLSPFGVLSSGIGALTWISKLSNDVCQTGTSQVDTRHQSHIFTISVSFCFLTLSHGILSHQTCGASATHL